MNRVLTPHVITTHDELEGVVQQLLLYDAFVIDVETTFDGPHQNEIKWVGLASHGTATYLVPIQHPNGLLLVAEHTEKRLPPDEERKVLKNGKLSEAKRDYRVPPVFQEAPKQLYAGEVFDILEPLLFSDRQKIGHNLKFDLLSIAKYYGGTVPPGPYHDTIIITHLLNENLIEYGLKPTILDWFNVGVYQVDGKRVTNKYIRESFYPNIGKQGIEGFPINTVAGYLAQDVRYTWLLWNKRYPMLKDHGLEDAYSLEMALYGVLMDMECAGVSINLTHMSYVKDDLERQIRDIEHDVWRMAGVQFPLSNTNKKRDLLFLPKKEGGQGLKPIGYTPKDKKPILNQATLEKYRDTNQMAALFLQWSELEKLRGTFIEGLSSHLIKGKVHTSFKQHSTVTGRLSAADPNLQQIPRESSIRELFIPDPGHVFVVADYDQIELRCAAFLSQDENMMNVFIEAQDIHRAAAAAMYNKALEDVTPEERQAGKSQNFLTLYGGGAAKLARVAKVDVDQAERFIARYYVMFPGLLEWKKKVVTDAMGRGDRNNLPTSTPYVTIPPVNRRRRLIDLFSFDQYERFRAERQAVNAVVQGFASNVMKQALIDLSQTLPANSRMLLTVHDEVIVQTPLDDNPNEIRTLVESVMADVKCLQGLPILGNVPLIASANIGSSWAEAKGK